MSKVASARTEAARAVREQGAKFPLVAAGVLVAAVLILYWSSLQGLVVDWWTDDNYSHGFLVPVFSGYLVWQRREELFRSGRNGSWLGLPVLLFGLGMLLVGDLAAEHFTSRSSLIVVASALVLLHMGSHALRVLWFPLAFLFFMIPLPAILFNSFALPLQALAAENATWALDKLGIPVLRDGNVIHLSHITLGVTEACSGIRSLISLLALAVAWGYLTLPGVWWRMFFVAIAVPITIVMNAGRVVVTGLIGQWFGIEYAQGFFHSFSGWVIFILSFACLLGVHGTIAVWSRRHQRNVVS